MGILNWIVLFLIAIYIMQGLHKGFLISVANTIGMALSWVIGFVFSPLMSQAIAKGPFYKFLLYFTNGVDQLQASGNMLVTTMTQPQIDQVVSTANLPAPFDQLVTQNMTNAVFESAGLHTVSEYVSYTITNVVVNIFAFLVIYVIARIIIALLVNAYNYASPLPVLRKYDSLIGGGAGVLRGFLGMFALFMIIPVILVSMPTDLIADIINGSSFVSFFYHNNFLLAGISGII
ncbi:CvpA family protein [Christensenella timonensis]|uniref:CvpA family protein n=1 Tax=Christensenella timonensis TaxID=1816678 RepID=UPI000830274A|nr:CvpA family protein [Christensenella timonensis]